MMEGRQGQGLGFFAGRGFQPWRRLFPVLLASVLIFANVCFAEPDPAPVPETIPGGVEITATAIAAAASGRMMESDAETEEAGETETQVEHTYMVSVDMPEGISLRKGAGWEYGIVGEPIPDDTMLEISDRMETATGEIWGYTEYEGRNGWVPLADTDRESFSIEDAYFLRIDSNGQIIDDFSAPAPSSSGSSARSPEEDEEEADSAGIADSSGAAGSDGILGEGDSDGTASSDGTAFSDGTDSSGAAEEEKKGGLPLIPIIIGGVVLLAGIGAGVGLFLRSRRRKKQAAAGDAEAGAEEAGGKKGKKEKKKGGFKLPFPKLGRKKKKEG